MNKLDDVQKDHHIEALANLAIKKLYMKEERLTTYIALEEMNFTWSLEEVEEFEEMWREACSLTEIAAHFKRTHEEVAVLIMDRALNKRIKPRKNGIFGEEKS